jgi:hypothetical protein
MISMGKAASPTKLLGRHSIYFSHASWKLLNLIGASSINARLLSPVTSCILYYMTTTLTHTPPSIICRMMDDDVPVLSHSEENSIKYPVQ